MEGGAMILGFRSIRQCLEHAPSPQGVDQQHAPASVYFFQPGFGSGFLLLSISLSARLGLIVCRQEPGMLADNAVNYFMIGCHC